MPHLPMRQIRQIIWVNHIHLVFASLSLSIYILIHTSDRSNLAKFTNLTLSVVPKSSLILCINKGKPQFSEAPKRKQNAARNGMN
ncbi:hypothetical protein TB1_013515 [Malus domestica]